MKKITLSSILMIALLLSGTSIAFADSPQKLNATETKDKTAGSTINKIEKRFGNMSDRYLKTIDREDAIVVKIESRIAKIKTAGGNTTEAEKFVADAKTALTSARTSYETLKTMADTADSATTTPKQIMTSMKNAVKTIDKYLRTAHGLLQKTIGNLRGVSQLQNATPTKTN